MRGVLICLGFALVAVGVLYTVTQWFTDGVVGWTPDGSAFLVVFGLWMLLHVAQGDEARDAREAASE